MMSANSTAASTPCRRTGCSVTSAHSSGVAATSKNAVTLAQRAVLGQRAARLAHEPHRRALDRLARARPGREAAPRHAPRLARRHEYLRPARRALARLEHRAGRGGRAQLVTRRGRERRQRALAHARPRGRPVPRTTGSTSAATRSSGTACARRSSAASTRARRCERELAVRAPIPPGRYRLAVDLVEEHRFWLAELGNTPLERGRRRRAARRERRARFPPEAPSRPTTGTSACRELHEEGYAAVGGAIETRRRLAGARTVRARRRAPPARSRIRSSARRCCRRSSRTPRWPGCRPTRPEGDEPSMFDGRLGSDFDRDLVVDAPEDERAERERHDRTRRRDRARRPRTAACPRRAARAPPRSPARADSPSG